MGTLPADESALTGEPPPQPQPPESPGSTPPRSEQPCSKSDSRVPPDAAGDTNTSATDDPALVTLSGAEAKSDLAVHLAGEVMEIRAPTSEGISFTVGDLVWGKTKNHPWWPALVSDPSAAPDAVRKAQRRDVSLLVSCFGSGTFFWCDASQMKPFVEEFHPMARQSNSKSFIGAVEAALDLVRQRLQLELTCRCISPEARAKNTGGSTWKISLTNLQPLEFLEHLRNVACDVTLADMLQVQALKSWVMAFGKGWRDGSPGYHPHRELMELVDKIDLDEPPGDPDDGECWITGSGVGGHTKTSEDNIHENQKKTSMVALIAGMDLDTVELSDADEVKVEDKVKVVKRHKKFEIDKVMDADSGEVDAQGDIGSGRRARKKSKYLSPPYTCLGAFINSPCSPRNAEVKSTRRPLLASQALDSDISALLDNSEALEKEDDASTPDLSTESTSIDDILSEFLCTARNPLHLKWNRSAKMIKSFLIKYRSSMYSSGHDFLTYQKHQNESCDKNIGSIEKATVNNCSEVGRSVGQQKHREDAANSEVGIGLNDDSRIHSEQGKTGKKRKMRKDAKNTLPANIDPLIINVPVESSYADKSIESKDGATGKSAGLCAEQVSCFQPIEIGNKMIKSRGVANGKKTADSGHDLSECSAEGKSGKKRKKSRPANTNGLQHNKSGHLKKDDESCYSYPGALLLTFAPGVPLPSQTELISTFSNYGVVLESETELQKDTNCARIVFAKSTDAEKVLNSSDKIGIFAPPNVSYRLHYLPPIACSPPPIPPLPYIRESLEKMISTLNTTSSVKETGPSDAIKLDAKENLVGDMEGLLKKVNTMLNGAPAGT